MILHINLSSQERGGQREALHCARGISTWVYTLKHCKPSLWIFSTAKVRKSKILKSVFTVRMQELVKIPPGSGNKPYMKTTVTCTRISSNMWIFNLKRLRTRAFQDNIFFNMKYRLCRRTIFLSEMRALQENFFLSKIRNL